MSNELISPQAMLTAIPSVGQSGKNNVNVTNQNGGIVNINYNIHPEVPADSAEKMIAVQQFSKQYYQLFVTAEEDVIIKKIPSFVTGKKTNLNVGDILKALFLR